MCPVAAESKNSKPSSKKKINKKINTNLETVVEEDVNKNSQSLQTSSELNEGSIDNNNEFMNSEIGDIKWFHIEEAVNKIRNYNIDKKNKLMYLHEMIKNTLENFITILNNF